MPSSPEAATLAATQRAFAAALRGGPAANATLAALLGGDPAVGLRRFRAYRRNVLGNWVAALRSTCPAVVAALGEADFMAVARDYVLSHDSPSGDLDEYGADFAGHLAATPGLPPWLADLARLEWRVQEAYYAADAEAFDFAALAGVPAERHGELRFSLAPAFRSLSSDWPLAELWQCLQAGDTPALPVAAARVLWIVRPFGRVRVETAAAGEAAFTTALANQLSLGEAIGSALAADGGFDVGATLGRIAGLGLLTGFTLQGEEQ